ncbi:hypothetical protein B0H14DRAFT_2498515 [Mycena olivaceomarginata]|nr:hypothetical protein B0H14DRAFT_2498515 [Mycena olivaceomarginata]
MGGASGSGGSKARREEGQVGVRIDAALHSSGSAGGDAGTGGGEEGAGDDIIRCICGSSTDDGFSIACDGCGRWCHCACFAIAKDCVPDNWWCWKCRPGDHLDLPPNGYAPPPLPAAPSKSRRRASISGKWPTTTVPADASPPLSNGGNAHIDDMEDERTQYVQIEDDIVPHAATQRKLRAYAAQWRGVSALEATPPTHTLGHGHGHTPFVFGGAPPAPHPTLLHPSFPSSHSAAAACSALPPTYALHTALPAPPHTLLARYPALITPTSAYMRAPPNGYAHAGAPKRFVHLVGPPLDVALDVALDARGAGGRGRWVRSGCWPNAEVRADAQPGKDGKGKGKKREGRERGDEEDDAPQTHFGIFATRALKQGEEIVVGWEWDDANAVHRVGEGGRDGGVRARFSFLSLPVVFFGEAMLDFVVSRAGSSSLAISSHSAIPISHLPSGHSRAHPLLTRFPFLS